MINFNDPTLVKKYGSWIKVQVAFYDFLFVYSQDLCPHHFNEMTFKSAHDFYEIAIEHIEDCFESADDAWNKFILETTDELTTH